MRFRASFTRIRYHKRNSPKFVYRILHSTGPIGPESPYGSTPKR
jgi:hypothetical protein